MQGLLILGIISFLVVTFIGWRVLRAISVVWAASEGDDRPWGEISTTDIKATSSYASPADDLGQTLSVVQ